MALFERICAEIDRSFGEQVEFLKTLVKCKSVLFHEAEMQRAMARKLRQLGLEVDVFDADMHSLSLQPDYSPVEWGYKDRPQVVGIWKSKAGAGKSLILNGHADVVPVEAEELWTYDPWEPQVVGDRMYGRGAGDMKCGLAAIVYAVSALRNLGIHLDGDLLIESVIEEEASGNGTLACFNRGYTADAAFIAESIGAKMLIAQPGSLWLRVRVYGAAGHVEGLYPSVSAIEQAITVIQAIRELEGEWNREKHEAYKHLENPMNFAIGMIQGGCWPSSTPSLCEFTVRFGLFPGTDPQEAEKRLTEQLNSKLARDSWLKEHLPEYNWYGHRHTGFVLNPDEEFYRTIARNHLALHGEPVKHHIAQACSDTVYFINRGIPATCYGPMGLNAHAADEHVELSSMLDATKVIAATIIDWCGTTAE